MTRPLKKGETLVVASHNLGKVREIEELIAPFGFAITSAGALDLPEPEETGTTFEENARIKALAAAEAGSGAPMTKGYVSKCLSDAIATRPATVLSELGCPLAQIDLKEHNTWFQEPHSGGLGWGFGAALGAQLAEPDRVVVATMGDGSYMFANPTVCHQIAEALELPVLVIVLNNEEWGAVRASVSGLYPDGYAAKANKMPLTALKPSPDFTLTAAASRGWARKVSKADDLPGVLEEAIAVVTKERRQALVEVATLPG